MDFITIFTAFGLGSVVTTLVQYILTNRAVAKRRAYDERKEAYLGLAENWVKQDQDGANKSNALDVGHWFLRCQFVAPSEMLEILRKWEESRPDTQERVEATKMLKDAMRRDLSRFR